MRRNPAAGEDVRPLVLDGQELELIELRQDGEALGSNRYQIDGDRLVVHDLPAAFTLESTVRIRPERNTALEGLYVSNGVFCTQCEPEGFRKITYFPDRPDVMARYRVRIEADRAACPVLLANGNLVEQRQSARGQALRALGRPVPEAQLPVRPGRGPPRQARGQLHHALGPRRHARDLCRAARDRQMRPRHGLAQEGDALGRGALRPGVRPRPVHDRGGVRFQLRRHGEQGPEHLQHQVRAGQAGDRDRQRLSRRRERDRARVFPQLDRQSGDLPRLVPAGAQGGADGLPRPGVHRRPAFARGQAHRRRAPAARHPVRGGCGAARPPGAARQLPRDQQFLHRHGVRKGRRGDPHAAHADRRGGVPAGHAHLLRAPRRPGGAVRGLRRRHGDRVRPGPHPVPPLVQPGRHAAPDRARRARPARAHLHAGRGANDAADARSARQAAAAHAARARPARSGRAAAAPATRGRGRAGRHRARPGADRGRAPVHLHRRPRRGRCPRCCAASRRR